MKNLFIEAYSAVPIDEEFHRYAGIIVKYSNDEKKTKDNIMKIVDNYKNDVKTINTIMEVLSFASISDKMGSSPLFVSSVYNHPRTKEIIKSYDGNENIVHWIFSVAYTTKSMMMVDRLLDILENREIANYIMNHRDVNLMKILENDSKYIDVYLNGIESLKKYRE